MRLYSLCRPPLPPCSSALASELEEVRVSLQNLIHAIPCVAEYLPKQHPAGATSELQVTSGKLLRPALLLLSAKLCYKSRGHEGLDEKTRGQALDAAVAVEAIHTASLWHDDVLDNSPIRRGQKSVPEQVGNRRAVLYGDMLISQALELIVNLGDISLLAALAQVVKTMSQAQIQEQNQRGHEVSMDDYLSMIGGKTASLLSFCCRLGAEIGRGTQEEVLRLQRFGHNLGMAFQIGDDILDIWGDPNRTGKVALGDWEEQNLTLPVILALRKATPEQRAHLLSLLDCPEPEASQQLPHLLTELEALPPALECAQSFAQNAESELADWPACPEQRLLREWARWSGHLEQLSEP